MLMLQRSVSSARLRPPLARLMALPLLLASPLLLFGGCGEEAEVPAAGPRPVKILTVGQTAEAIAFEYPGQIAAVQEAVIAFEVSGQIVSFPVQDGEAVAKGQTLARLDDRDYVARRDAQRATFNVARTDYERFRELYEENAVSLQDLELKRRQFEVAEAEQRTADKALADTELKAPFAGRVARTLVENFQNVRAKQDVLLLQDLTSLDIDNNFPEGHWARLEKPHDGDKTRELFQAEVTVSAFPKYSFPATVKDVATAADPATRTFKATFSIDTPSDILILPGMTARLVIAPNLAVVGGQRILLPAGATIADDAGNAYVWKVDPQTMQVSRAAVTMGELSGAEVEILSGLSVGDQVAVSGVKNLRDGMQVSRYGGQER
jgi:RND family efflux transporter MFP subunit